MVQKIDVLQRVQRCRLFALLVPALLYSLAIRPTESTSEDAPVASAITFDTLSWNTSRIAEHKKKLPTYLRNRKIKNYALAAAIIGGTVGYMCYSHYYKTGTPDTATPSSAAPDTIQIAPPSTESRLQALEKFQKATSAKATTAHSDWLASITGGKIKMPAVIQIDPVVQLFKTLITCNLGTIMIQKAVSIFNFREDMPWFYNEEKAIPGYAKELEAFALNLDACLATQPQASASCVAVKKQLLVDAADLYLDNLMALYAFMDYRAQQIVAPFDSEIKEKLLPRFNNLTTSIAQVGIQLSEKLNSIVTNNTRGGIPSADTARTAVMQAQSLVHALVMSFGRLEEAYAQ